MGTPCQISLRFLSNNQYMYLYVFAFCIIDANFKDKSFHVCWYGFL